MCQCESRLTLDKLVLCVHEARDGLPPADKHMALAQQPQLETQWGAQLLEPAVEAASEVLHHGRELIVDEGDAPHAGRVAEGTAALALRPAPCSPLSGLHAS